MVRKKKTRNQQSQNVFGAHFPHNPEVPTLQHNNTRALKKFTSKSSFASTFEMIIFFPGRWINWFGPEMFAQLLASVDKPLRQSSAELRSARVLSLLWCYI